MWPHKKMTYTEQRKVNGKNYFYRVLSLRKNSKVSKKRIYLGVNLIDKELNEKEKQADKELLGDRKNKEVERIKIKIIKILKKNKIKKAGIFGSYARGEQKKNSDIDIAVEINNPKMSLLGFVKIINSLEKILKRKVDLVEYDSIKPRIKERILNEEIRII